MPCTLATTVLIPIKWFLNVPTQASFCLFLFFSNTNCTEKTVGFSRIRTRIVRVEGKHADHLTTTTAQIICFKKIKNILELPHINKIMWLKVRSHYCFFCVRLRQTVAFLKGDRKCPISVLTQLTAENADRCV